MAAITKAEIIEALGQLNTRLGFDFTLTTDGDETRSEFPGVALRLIEGEDLGTMPVHVLLLEPGYDNDGKCCHMVRVVEFGPGDDTLWFRNDDGDRFVCSWPAMRWENAIRQWSDYVTGHQQEIREADARLMKWARETVAAGEL